MGMNNSSAPSVIRPLNITRPSTPSHRKKKFDFLRRRGDRHPLRKDDAVHVRTRVFQQSVTFVARMEYDPDGEPADDLKPTSPATVETKEYWLDDWSHKNKPGQYYSSFDVSGNYLDGDLDHLSASASSASSAVASAAGDGVGFTVNRNFANDINQSSNNNDASLLLPGSSASGSPSPGQLFAVAAVSTACFFFLAGVMALIVWQCCRLKKGKKQSGEKGGQGDKIFEGPTGGLGSDDPGEAPPSYFQKQGDSLVLVRSDSKGEGFQTTVCRAASVDEDDEHEHYYYYRPTLPRSISAPLKDLQGLKISCPAGATAAPKPGPADETKLSSFLGPDGPPPPYSYERLSMSPSGAAIKSGWATTGPPGSRSGRHFQHQQQQYREQQEWMQHQSLHRRQHQQQPLHQRRGTYGGAEGGGDPSGVPNDNGTDKQTLLPAEYAQQHGSPAQDHPRYHQQQYRVQQDQQQYRTHHPAGESLSTSTSPSRRQLSYAYHAQCSPSSSSSASGGPHKYHFYENQQASERMGHQEAPRGATASSGAGMGYRHPCHDQSDVHQQYQQHGSPHRYSPGGLVVKAVPYGSSGVLAEADPDEMDDPYAGCDVNPDLKSRSLPNRLKKKQPHFLVPTMAMAGCPSGVVPSMSSFKFTRKLKNRMKNDTAAIIAMAKSTGDCCEAGRGDTEALIAGPPAPGAKVVYEERTCL